MVRAVGQVCDALSHAHHQNVFHRDIKPNNILVRLPDEVVKVADWGVAKNTDMDGLWEGSIVGTRPYMPPEVLVRMDLYRPLSGRSDQRIDHRADIFSLGVTVFKIVASRHPFKNPHEIDNAEHRAIQEEILTGLLGAPLAAAIMKALEHDADNRYQDAMDFAAALELALNPGGSRTQIVTRPTGPTMEERLEEVSGFLRDGNSDGSVEGKYRAIITAFPD